MSLILSINGNLDAELKNLGYEVISKTIGQAGIYSAVDLLNDCPRNPEFFIQREHLGARIIFKDLCELPCRTVFWSIDTHLHYAWQMYYAQLFDVLLTPHKSFIERLNVHWQHPNMHRLAQNGFERPWIAHEARKHKINFVGRLTGSRNQRERLGKLLSSRYNTNIKDNISFSNMLNLYDDTCIIPNESICNEVNFRLLEGASCGACVISPDVGEDQNLLFEPNREILIYKNIDELQALIDLCIKKPDLCEKIAYAAWQRVQKEHTKLHRATQLMTAIQGMQKMRKTEYTADILKFIVGIMNINQVWNIVQKPQNPTSNLTSLPLRILLTVFEAQWSNYHENQDKLNNIFEDANACISDASTKTEDKKALCIACGGVAIELEDIARSFFYFRIHEQLCNAMEPQDVPKDFVQMSMAWVAALKRESKQCFTGAAFQKGCYRTAFDFVSICREIDPFRLEWAHALNTLDHVLHSFPEKEREGLLQILE